MKKMFFLAPAATAFAAIILFTGASTGPGVFYNSGYTAAPFDGNIYCSSCHGGGSFTPSITLQLLNASNQPVTNYTPGSSYTLYIHATSSTGITPNTHYGFQTVCVSGAGNPNAGSWGVLNPDHHGVQINGREYVEHSTPLSSGDIYVPWTAPATGGNPVTFYTACNIVNFNGGSNGDNPTTATLTMPEQLLTMKLAYFRGKRMNNKVTLEWSGTTTEGCSFALERSGDGRHFERLTTVASRSVSSEYYQFTDITPLNDGYYRLGCLERDGIASTYSPTIRIKAEQVQEFSIFVTNSELHLMLGKALSGYLNINLVSLTGVRVASQSLQLNGAESRIIIPRPSVNGVYILMLQDRNELLYSERLVIQ